MTASEFSREAIARAVREVIVTVLPAVAPHTIQGHEHLQDLGADSVDRVEIVLMLLDRLQLDEPMASFNKLPDINALTTFLYERTQA